MWIKGGTWANLNGSKVDPYDPVTNGYTVNGVRIMSCLLEKNGQLNFSLGTPLAE